MEHLRLTRGEPVDRPDQPVAVEGSDRHPTLTDRGDQQVDRDEVDLPPYPRFQNRQWCELGGGVQFPILDRHPRRTSTDSVTESRKGRSSVTPMPGPDGTGMIPSVASRACSVMSRA